MGLGPKANYDGRGSIQGRGNTMQEEKWNQFAVTGKVSDYLSYKGCMADHTVGREGEETNNGTDHSVEWNRAVSDADWRIR